MKRLLHFSQKFVSIGQLIILARKTDINRVQLNPPPPLPLNEAEELLAVHLFKGQGFIQLLGIKGRGVSLSRERGI